MGKRIFKLKPLILCHNFIALSLIFGCEKQSFLDYILVNNSSETIVISKLKVHSEDSLIEIPTEIKPNEKATIYVYKGVGNTSRFVNGDTIHGIQVLEVFRSSDTTYLNKNLRLSKYWTFQEKDKTINGEIKASVVNDDFN